MRTDELIRLLTYDARPVLPFRIVFQMAALAGVAVSGVLFFALIGVRPDFAYALRTEQFLLKFAVTVPLAIGAGGLALAIATPGAPRAMWLAFLILASAVLAGAALADLWSLPPASWQTAMLGHNARFCLTLIPMLSIGPFASLFAVLRQGAPANPGIAGASAGLAAAAIAATYYAANCDDDSPLFIMFWYTIAVGFVVACGYRLGRRYLT